MVMNLPLVNIHVVLFGREDGGANSVITDEFCMVLRRTRNKSTEQSLILFSFTSSFSFPLEDRL